MNKKMSKQVSEWIGVEQNKWMFLFPWFGLSSFWKCPLSHTSTQSQSLADQYLTLSLGTGPGCSACWATDILPKAVLSSMAHNLTGTKSSSGQAMLCWTVVPLVADSSAVTAVMMAFCQGCGRKAGRCWGRGHWQVESTWLLPSIFMLRASVEPYDGEGQRGGLHENWDSSMTLVKSCNLFVFQFLTCQALKCYDFEIKNSASYWWLLTPTYTDLLCTKLPLKKRPFQRREWARGTW